MIHHARQVLRQLAQHLRRINAQFLRHLFDMLARGRALQCLSQLFATHGLVGAIAYP